MGAGFSNVRPTGTADEAVTGPLACHRTACREELKSDRSLRLDIKMCRWDPRCGWAIGFAPSTTTPRASTGVGLASWATAEKNAGGQCYPEFDVWSVKILFANISVNNGSNSCSKSSNHL